jgi:curved DNA-binding protein CbpA
MNYKKACEILELDPVADKSNKCAIKKKYHILALRYHPDKNKEPNANERFLEIHEAYQFLMENENYDSTIPTYEAIVRFFTGSLSPEVQQEYLQVTLEKVVSICEKQAIHMIETVPYDKFKQIYNILTRYKHIFPLSQEFHQAMEKKAIYWFSQGSLKKKRNTEDNESNNDFEYNYDMSSSKRSSNNSVSTEEYYQDYNFEMTESEFDLCDNETMILRPVLDDVIVDNVYKCVYADVEQSMKLAKPLYIPLWHHELTYDKTDDTELTVKIIPKLPSTNYWIDDENNLHQRIEYTLCELWDYVAEEKYLEIFFGKKRFIFYPQDLQLMMHQTWTWRNQGISKINMTNIYDVSLRADVVLHIHITGIL